MLRPLWRMLQITPTAFRTPARAGSRYQLCSSFSSNLGYSIAFRSSSSEAGPAVSLLSALGSATVAAKQLKQPAFQASVAAFRQTPGSDRPISNTVAVAAARSSSSMQPQQQQYSHLLMSPEQQQQLLESVKDRPPVTASIAWACVLWAPEVSATTRHDCAFPSCRCCLITSTCKTPMHTPCRLLHYNFPSVPTVSDNTGSCSHLTFAYFPPPPPPPPHPHTPPPQKKNLCPGVFAALVATLHYAARGVTPRYVPHEVYKQVDLQQLQLQVG
jgi:hypothetical protein